MRPGGLFHEESECQPSPTIGTAKRLIDYQEAPSSLVFQLRHLQCLLQKVGNKP